MGEPTKPLTTCIAKQGVLVVTILVEEIRESDTAYAFRDEVVSQVHASGARNVVFDAARVRFIGSVGFLAFLGVRRHLTGGRIVICNMSDPIREMFAVCRLISNEASSASPFEATATTEEALLRLGVRADVG